MPKPRKKLYPAPRRALAAYAAEDGDDPGTQVQNLITDLGLLCDCEKLDFVQLVQRAIRHWAVERIDPNSLAEGPVVEIYVGSEGLPQPPKLKPRRRTKPKKVRPPL